jgi:hypothetical protein
VRPALLSVSILLLAASVTAQDGWTEHREGPVSLRVPADWSRLPPMAVSPPVRLTMILAAPATPTGRFPNVTVTEEPAAMPAYGYLQQSLSAVSQMAQVVNTQTVSVGAHRAMDIEARWPDNRPPTQALQRVTAVNGTGYTVTCSTALGAMALHRATCQRILSSLRIQ